jgi:hypothetical protein
MVPSNLGLINSASNSDTQLKSEDHKVNRQRVHLEKIFFKDNIERLGVCVCVCVCVHARVCVYFFFFYVTA